MKINYNLSEPSADLSTVRLTSTINGQRLRYRLKIQVPTKHWDNATRRPKRRSYKLADYHRQQLVGLATDLQSLAAEYSISGKPFTKADAEQELDRLTGKAGSGSLTMLDWVAEYIDAHPSFKPSTRKKHVQALNKLRAFNPKLDWDDVTLDFHSRFCAYCYAIPLAPSTVGTHVKQIKAWMSAAHDSDVHQNTIYRHKRFNKPNNPSDALALTTSEVEALEAANLPKALARTRDLFLLGCYTGQRISDYDQINRANYTEHSSGGRTHGGWNITQTKTGKVTFAPATPQALEILDNYGGSSPDKISSQVFNRQLKQVCKLAGLTRPTELRTYTGTATNVTTVPLSERVTSHTARRTFATRLYKLGANLSSIQAVLGHHSVTQTEQYVKATRSEKAAQLAETDAWRRFAQASDQ